MVLVIIFTPYLFIKRCFRCRTKVQHCFRLTANVYKYNALVLTNEVLIVFTHLMIITNHLTTSLVLSFSPWLHSWRKGR